MHGSLSKRIALCSLVLFSCSCSCCWSRPNVNELFVGWGGESYKPNNQQAQNHNKWIEVVSWHPRAFVYHNFLSDEEAEHIKRLAAPTMKQSSVVNEDGSFGQSNYRTSYGTFLSRKGDPVVERVHQRVAEWAHLPPVHAEAINVLRYGVGQYYKEHMDVISDHEAGARACTVLMYLNDVPEGGETAFPHSNHWVNDSLPERLGPFSVCAKGHVAFRPKKGDALMFWSVKPDGEAQDFHATHTGCPVLKGVKWTATVWIHAQPFQAQWYDQEADDPGDTIDPGICEDRNRHCKAWARRGECTADPEYMVGVIDSPGNCRKACKECTPCSKGDRKCYNENRRRAGYLVYDDNNLDLEVPMPGL